MQNNIFSIAKPPDLAISPSKPSKTLVQAVSTSYSLPVSAPLAYLPICISAGLTTNRWF